MKKPDVSMIQQLKRDRRGKFDQLEKLREEVRGKETAEDRSKLSAMLDEIEGMNATIETEERALAIYDASVEYEDQKAAEATPGYNDAFRSFLRGGMADMSAEHRNAMLKNAVDTRALGLAGSAGGYAVPQEFYNSVVQIMTAYGGMRAAMPTILTTAGGNDLPVPIVTDANVGEIVAEDAATNSADPVFSQMILKGYTYSSKMVRVHLSLLQDEAIGLESLLQTQLATRLARITNSHYTIGDDTNQPDGVLNTAADSGITTASATAITYPELVKIMHSVDPWYQANGKWMFNDSTLAILKQMSVGSADARPLWVPGVAVREPDTILGKPYVVNVDMPDYTTTNKAIIFGDFSQFFIRDVAGATLMRLTERYAEYAQVAFILWIRTDSGLANSAAIKYATVA